MREDEKDDRNGRMSRLLRLLLLYQEEYIVGKYISIEMIIEKTKESYYEVIEESSKGWHGGKNNYAPNRLSKSDKV
jgi:Fic family protein